MAVNDLGRPIHSRADAKNARTGVILNGMATPTSADNALPLSRPALGYAFLDNSTLAQLQSITILERFWERLEYLGLTLLLTELNVLQAMAAGPLRARRLLEILTAVARSDWVLPTPDVVLRDAITQSTAARSGLSTELFALNHPDAIEDFENECRRARAWTAHADQAYAAYLHEHRAATRTKLRQALIRPTLEHLPAFIANWPRMSEYGAYRQHLWRRLGFDGSAPAGIEQRLPVLRLEMAAQGVGLFEHIMAYDGGRPTERTDLLHVCYLGMAEHCLLISNDKGLRRAANIAVPLSGLGGFALSLDELLSTAEA